MSPSVPLRHAKEKKSLKKGGIIRILLPHVLKFAASSVSQVPVTLHCGVLGTSLSL